MARGQRRSLHSNVTQLYDVPVLTVTPKQTSRNPIMAKYKSIYIDYYNCWYHHHYHHHHLALQLFVGFPFLAKSLQVLLSLAASFQFLTFSFFRSSMTSSCHLCLGLPTGLVPIGFQSNSFPVGLAWSILWIRPSPLIHRTLTLRSLTLYIYGAPILDVSRSHTTTQHSR